MCGAPLERDPGNSRQSPDSWYEETRPITGSRPVERGWSEAAGPVNTAASAAGSAVGGTAGSPAVSGSKKRWIPIVAILAVLVGGFLIFNLLRDPVIGTWKATERQYYGETYEINEDFGMSSLTVSFNNDHTFSLDAYYSDSDPSVSYRGSWEKTAKGEYRVTVYDEGDVIYLDASLQGKTLSIAEEDYEEEIIIFKKK